MRRLVVGIVLISILVTTMFVPVTVNAQEQLVKNGTFSNGLNSWRTGVISSSGGYPIITVHENFQGDQSLYIDAPGGTDGYIEQTVSIPKSSNVVLMFHTWGNQDSVTITVSIIDDAGRQNVLDKYDPSCKIDKGCRTPAFKRYDITSYNGQTIKLRLRVSSNYNTGTFGWFDDVQILATTAPDPEPEEYTLRIKIDGCGDTDPSEGRHTFNEGDRVVIEADPSCRDWEFDRWRGADSTNGRRATVTMNSDKTVTAYFEELEPEEDTLNHDPVLLIHGLDGDIFPFKNNFHTWDKLIEDLENVCGWKDGGIIKDDFWDRFKIWRKAADFYELELTDGSNMDYDQQADEVEYAVDKINKKTKRKVILVGHSMGGLSARAYLQEYGNDAKVSGIITISTPHAGSYLAYLPWVSIEKKIVAKIIKPNIARLLPCDGDLLNLNESIYRLPKDIKYFCIISEIEGPKNENEKDLRSEYVRNMVNAILPSEKGDYSYEEWGRVWDKQILPEMQDDVVSCSLKGKEISSIGIIKRSDGLVPITSQYLVSAAITNSSSNDWAQDMLTRGQIKDRYLVNTSHDQANKQSDTIIETIKELISSIKNEPQDDDFKKLDQFFSK